MASTECSKVEKMNIKHLRQSSNLSQQKLSDMIGIPKARIAKWEQGKGHPKSSDLEILKTFFSDHRVKTEEKKIDSKTNLSKELIHEKDARIFDLEYQLAFNQERILELEKVNRDLLELLKFNMKS